MIKRWLLERRLTVFIVGAVVPALAGLAFWDVIGRDWPIWVASYCVGIPAAIVVLWGRERISDRWSRLEKHQRVLIRCLAIVLLWLLLIFSHRGDSDRLLVATLLTAAAAILWCCYAVFSRAMDWIWYRARRR